MYYCRFKEDALEKAHATERITSDEYCAIKQFYCEGILTVPEETLEQLGSIVKFEITSKNDDASIVIRVLEWPFNKYMCLKFAPSFPARWRYENESEKVLFFYDVIQKVITFPKEG